MILLANGRVITRDPDGVGYFKDGGVVTDGGKIVEDGSYDELMAKKGFFADLVDRQRLSL